MKAAVSPVNRGLRQEPPVQQVGPEEALIGVKYAGICGSGPLHLLWQPQSRQPP